MLTRESKYQSRQCNHIAELPTNTAGYHTLIPELSHIFEWRQLSFHSSNYHIFFLWLGGRNFSLVLTTIMLYYFTCMIACLLSYLLAAGKSYLSLSCPIRITVSLSHLGPSSYQWDIISLKTNHPVSPCGGNFVSLCNVCLSVLQGDVEEDEHIADKESDIKPRFHRAKSHTQKHTDQGGGGDGGDDDDDE